MLIMKKTRNPFRKNFFLVVFVSIICLLIVTSVIGNLNNRKAYEKAVQKSVQETLVDIENQFQLAKDVAVKISSDYRFHPYYFEENISREMSMLEILKSYQSHFVLSKSFFIYYGGDRIYRSTGVTLDLQLYMNNNIKNREEKTLFINSLEKLMAGNALNDYELVLSFTDDIYLLFPIRVSRGGKTGTAVFSYVMLKKDLRNRMDFISGYLNGNISIFYKNHLMETNKDKPCYAGQKNVYTAESENWKLMLCYLPESKPFLWNNTYMLTILMIIAFLMIFYIPYIISEWTFQPIRQLLQSYPNEVEIPSSIKEFELITEDMMKKHADLLAHIETYRKKMHQQIIQLLLCGEFDEKYLEGVETTDLVLPGCFYFVISVSYQQKSLLWEKILISLEKELDGIKDKENQYVCTYAYYQRSSQILYVLCNINAASEKDELVLTLCEMVETKDTGLIVGIGSTYDYMKGIYASRMESEENLNEKMNNSANNKAFSNSESFAYSETRMEVVLTLLESGRIEGAKKLLDSFLDEVCGKTASIFMQQYFYVNIVRRCIGFANKYEIEISKKTISMLHASKNDKGFKENMRAFFQELCEKYADVRITNEENQGKEIIKYIEEHFADYNISIEGIAEKMHVNTELVRQTVLRSTGKMYKDYLTCLRIQYAKNLLKDRNLDLTMICQKVGYANVSYFIRVFRERTGITPSKFRNSQQFIDHFESQ